MIRCFCLAWRYWCSLWRLSWDCPSEIDYHKWESKAEIRCRLANRHH